MENDNKILKSCDVGQVSQPLRALFLLFKLTFTHYRGPLTLFKKKALCFKGTMIYKYHILFKNVLNKRADFILKFVDIDLECKL